MSADEMYGDYPALCNCDDPESHDGAVTAAGRPSITDNARDEEPLAWCPGCGDRIPTEVIRERGVCSNCYGTRDAPGERGGSSVPPRSPAGRAETTIGWGGPRPKGILDDPAETTTATVEDAARAIHDRHCTSDDHGPHCMFWGEDYESAEALHARGLLATARTFPTREDLARAIASGYEPDHPAPNRHDYRAADAVLALLRGGDK